MAEGKKSFLMYCDVHETVKHLTDEQSGRLFKHLLSYVNDENPEANDPIVKIAFEPIKQALKRDLEKYELKKGERSNSGKLGNLKRYHEDLYEQVISKKITVKEAVSIAKTRKNSLSDDSDRYRSQEVANLAVIDSVIVSDIVTIDNSSSKKQCLEDQQWMETQAMQNKCNIPTIEKYLGIFEKHLIQISTQKKTLREFKTHFTNWLKKQEVKKVKLNNKKIRYG